MSLIYIPKGKAREYSPLALNVYTGGCEHACDYCYCANIQAWTRTPNVRQLAGLSRDAAAADEQVLLSFMSDPYQPLESTARNTLAALTVLRAHRCSVAILTKGGTRCLRDLELFKAWPESRIKIGATLTFLDPAKSITHEPGAALPQDRIDALRILRDNGVKTWASIEPVIDPEESLSVIAAALPFLSGIKIGKLNHVRNNTDWKRFGEQAVTMVRESGVPLYVKDDLRAAMPGFVFTAEEGTADSLCLSKRKQEKDLWESAESNPLQQMN